MPFEFKGGTPVFGNTDAKNAEHKDENDGSSPFINKAFESSPFKVLPTSSHHFGLNSITTTPLISSSVSSAATAAFAAPSFGVSSSFGTPLAFGRPASPWSVPAKRKQDEVAHKKSLEMLKPENEVSESSKQPGPTDVLDLALSRAITKQKAVMGDKAVGADQLLRLYGKRMEQEGGKLDAEALMEDLNEMAASNPEASRFLSFIFERAATYQGGMIRGARNVRRQNQSMGAPASKNDADKENEQPDDSEELRSRLRSLVHHELVDRGFEKPSPLFEGLKQNTQARVYTQITMESATQEQLLSGLKEEWLRDAKGSEVEDFAHWLWDTVSELKKTIKEEGDEKKEAVARKQNENATGDPPAQRSLSQRQEEKREKSRELSPLPIAPEVVKKSDRYKNLGFKGYRGKNPQSEGITCCNWIPEMTSDQLVNGHLYLHDEWLAMFKVWLRAKLEPSNGVDVDMAVDLILSLLKSEAQETDLKAAFVEQLSDVFGSDTSSVVHEAFQGIACKEFINKDTTMAVRNLKAEAKPPTPFDGPIDLDQPFRFMDLPPELRT